MKSPIKSPIKSLPQWLCNFHWVVPGEAARSAQIHGKWLGGFLAAHGIRAVVNLRGRHPEFAWWQREVRACQSRDVAHFDAMQDSRKLPTRTMLSALFEAFDAAPRPFLIKCSGGQDRTSLAAALYILHRDGWAAREAALNQFARFPFLHFPKREQRWLRHFLRYGEECAAGHPIGIWARDGYDPRAFAAWLDARGLRNSYRGLYPE